MVQDTELQSVLVSAMRERPDITDEELTQIATEYKAGPGRMGVLDYAQAGASNFARGAMHAGGTMMKMVPEMQIQSVLGVENPWVAAQRKGGQGLIEAAPEHVEAGEFGRFAEGVGSTAVMAPFALAGGPGVALASVIIEGGSEYFRSLEHDPENYGAAWRSFLVASPAAAAEGLVLPKALKGLAAPLAEILGKADRASGGGVIKGLLKFAAASYPGQYAQEYVQQLSSTLNDYLSDREVGTLREILGEAHAAGHTGGLIGLFFGAVGTGVSRAGEYRAAEGRAKEGAARILGEDQAAQTPESAPAAPDAETTGDTTSAWADFYGPAQEQPEAASPELAKIEDKTLRDFVGEVRKAGYEGPVEVVEAPEGTEQVLDLAKGVGIQVDFLQGEGPMPMVGAYGQDRVLIDAALPVDRQLLSVFSHEAAHHMTSVLLNRAQNPRAMLKVLGEVEKAFPGLLEGRSLVQYETRRMESLGEAYAPLDEKALMDEALATLAEDLPNALWSAVEDPARMEALAQEPAMLQRLIDWLLELGAKLGLTDSPSLRRMREVAGQDPSALEEELGAQRTAELASIMAEAFRELSGHQGIAKALKIGRAAAPAGVVVPEVKTSESELEERYADQAPEPEVQGPKETGEASVARVGKQMREAGMDEGARSMEAAIPKREKKRSDTARRKEPTAAESAIEAYEAGEETRFSAAYHGTGSKFDRFSDDKIGTGEGVQAYGFGHYFASKKAVAKWYRDSVAGEDWVPQFDGRDIEDNDHEVPTRAAVALLSEPEPGFVEDAIKELRQEAEYEKRDGQPDWVVEDYKESADWLEKNKDRISYRKPGQLLKVELAPKEDEYLLWDKPLSEQSEKARAALESLPNRALGLTGSQRHGGVPTGEDIYKRLGRGPAASAALLKAGIRGIKYLDGTSRGKGKGSYNYVVFDPGDIEIVTRFSPAPALNSPAFKKWFGDSKVVDAEGKPLVVYHGTNAGFSEFDTPAFFGSETMAVSYAKERGESAQVYPVYLSIQDPASEEDIWKAADRALDLEGPAADMLNAYQFITPNQAMEGEAEAVIGELRSWGFDGARIENDFSMDDARSPVESWVAFSPEQIKSATGNRGTFDPANADVRFSPAKATETTTTEVQIPGLKGKTTIKITPKKGLLDFSAKSAPKSAKAVDDPTIPMASQLDDIIRHVQNTMVDYKRAYEKTGDARYIRVHDRATRWMDIAVKEREGFEKEYVAPLMEKVGELEGSGAVKLKNADRYILERAAPERNAVLLEEKGVEDGSGIPTEEAQAGVAKAESGPQGSVYREIGELWDKLVDAHANMIVNYGLESREFMNFLADRYPHYAPMKTFVDPDAPEGRMLGIGRGADIRGREFKKAKGRQSVADSPIAHMLEQVGRTALRGNKMKVAQPLLEILQENGGEIPGFAKVAGTASTKFEFNPETGKKEWVRNNPVPDSDMVVGIKETMPNGDVVERRIQFESGREGFAEALHVLTARQVGELTRHVGRVTRFMASMSTRWNPVFPIFNAIRDAGVAFFTSNEHGLAYASSVVANMPGAFSALLGVNKTNKFARAIDAYEGAGVKMSFLGLDQAASLHDEIARGLEPMKDLTSNSPKLRKLFKKLKRLMELWSDAVENAARLSTFVLAQERLGMSEESAAAYAKGITTNFRMKGLQGNFVNAWWMFSNAGIQGTARAMSALAVKGGKPVHPKVWKAVGAAVMVSAMLDWLNRMVSDEDDDGTRLYDGIPDYVKRNNIIIPHPNGKRFITIPAPFVYNWFHALGGSIGELAWSATTGETIRQPGEVAGNLITAAVDSFNPLGGTDQPLTLVSPTVVDPFLEIATNVDFAGRQVARKPFPGQVTPPSQQYWPDVSYTSRGITDAINSFTGGDEFEAGAVSINPEHIEHLAKFAMGGLGALVGRTYKAGEILTGGEFPEPFQIPAVRRIMRDPSPYALGSRFREALQAVDVVETRVDKLTASGDYKAARAAMKDDKALYLMVASAQAADKQVRKLKKTAARAPSPAQTVLIEDRIRRVQANFLRRYSAAVQR